MSLLSKSQGKQSDEGKLQKDASYFQINFICNNRFDTNAVYFHKILACGSRSKPTLPHFIVWHSNKDDVPGLRGGQDRFSLYTKLPHLPQRVVWYFHHIRRNRLHITRHPEHSAQCTRDAQHRLLCPERGHRWRFSKIRRVPYRNL